MTLSEDLTWLKGHVILLLIVLGLTFGGVYGVETLVSRHDEAVSSHLEAIAADTAKQNASIQAATQQQITLLTQQNVALEAQIAQLAQAISNRDAALLSQQAKIPALSPVQVASAIQPLISKGTATADSTGNVLLSPPASQEVLADLEELPIRRADIVDLTGIVTGQKTEISNLSTQKGSLQTALDSEKTSHVADVNACKAEIVTVKAEARKSKLKWFGIGVVVGFLGRGFAGF